MPYTEYDDLLTNDTRPSEYRDATELLSALSITAADVRGELSHYEMADLSNDTEAAISRCLEKAALWLIVKLRPTGRIIEDFLPDDAPALRDIVLKRTICELADYSGQIELAREKRLMVEDLAKALFGQFPTTGGDPLRPVVGAVVRPERRKYP